MGAITQNKIGTIQLTDDIIRQSILNYVKSSKLNEPVSIDIKQNDTNRFIFTIVFKNGKNKNFINDLDSLCSYVLKMIETNLQIFGSIVIGQISN
ncbi:MAG: hypothetical protein LBJ97_00225 [Mycoplasmataceae bacterium]|jgi:hypothetical protein|nr:hypothetical protein [Mycoplasmataceae bacterium]